MRRYLLIAAGILLAAAAVLHFSDTGDTSVGETGNEHNPLHSGGSTAGHPSSSGEIDAHPLVDPLVPPIRIDGFENDFADREKHHGPLLDPESLIGRIARNADFTKDYTAAFHPHGEQVCASGCALSRHPTKELTKEYFHELLAQYARDPMDESSFALESLLYFGRQTHQMLKEEGDSPLDRKRSRFLRSELKKTHAKVEVRVVDEFGEVRSWLEPTLVPLDRRHEFDMQVSNVQPLVTSGTVKRVGLYHVWNRL